MKLRIHHISHPLVQNLYNIIDESLSPKNIKAQATRHLGIFMMYETIRKLIRIYNLTIKQIKSNKEIVIIDPKDNYTIVFNDLDYLSMFQEIQLLLPKVNLKLIPYRDVDKTQAVNCTLENIDSHTKVIIVSYDISVQYLNNLIYLFTQKSGLNNCQISIICIRCNTNQLLQISENELYKNSTIYTTKIIKD